MKQTATMKLRYSKAEAVRVPTMSRSVDQTRSVPYPRLRAHGKRSAVAAWQMLARRYANAHARGEDVVSGFDVGICEALDTLHGEQKITNALRSDMLEALYFYFGVDDECPREFGAPALRWVYWWNSGPDASDKITSMLERSMACTILAEIAREELAQ